MRTLVPNGISMSFLKRLDIRCILILCSFICLFAGVARGENPLPPNYIFGIKKGTSLVLNIDAVEIANYKVLINGQPYTGGFSPHTLKNIHVYNLNELRNSTFFVHGFKTVKELLSGTFTSIAAWVKHLNKVSDAAWDWDEKRGILYGGKEGVSYGDFSITKANEDGIVTNFPSSVVSIAKSLIIDLPKGINEVTLQHILNGEQVSKVFEIDLVAR